jgi:hypothetical protein
MKRAGRKKTQLKRAESLRERMTQLRSGKGRAPEAGTPAAEIQPGESPLAFIERRSRDLKKRSEADEP